MKTETGWEMGRGEGRDDTWDKYVDVTQTGKGCGMGWDVGLVKRWDALRRVGMGGGGGNSSLM